MSIDQKLDQCESLLGYRFKDRSLLLEALTHASSASHRLLSNERLEFLGDSILGFIVCDYLYDQFPEWSEGKLTQVKSAAVSRQACGEIAASLSLREFLVLGKGMNENRQVPPSLLSNAFESIIGAIFLDAGIEPAREFVLPQIKGQLESILAGDTHSNFKSDLQHYAQRIFGEAPIYQVVDEKGPDHEKSFLVCAIIDGRSFEPAWGKNKKQAEQLAASQALQALGQVEQ